MPQKPPGISDSYWKVKEAVRKANAQFKRNGSLLTEPADWEKLLKKPIRSTSQESSSPASSK
jgi:hypothetical protein